MESKLDLTKQYYYGSYAVTVLHELPNNTAKISVFDGYALHEDIVKVSSLSTVNPNKTEK